MSCRLLLVARVVFCFVVFVFLSCSRVRLCVVSLFACRCSCRLIEKSPRFFFSSGRGDLLALSVVSPCSRRIAVRRSKSLRSVRRWRHIACS